MMCITDVSDEHMLPMLVGKLAYLFAFQANFRFIFIVLGLYSCASLAGFYIWPFLSRQTHAIRIKAHRDVRYAAHYLHTLRALRCM